LEDPRSALPPDGRKIKIALTRSNRGCVEKTRQLFS
jgi:hypothetical protein